MCNMKEYKGSNHLYNVAYALPKIKKYGLRGRYYEWVCGTSGAYYGGWLDVIKIDGKKYYISDKNGIEKVEK